MIKQSAISQQEDKKASLQLEFTQCTYHTTDMFCQELTWLACICGSTSVWFTEDGGKKKKKKKAAIEEGEQAAADVARAVVEKVEGEKKKKKKKKTVEA